MIATCKCGNITVRSAFQVSQGALCGETPVCKLRVSEKVALLAAANTARLADESRRAEYAEAKRLRKQAKNRRGGR